jgi:nucleotide-binding universal stress UspA family protein
MAHISELVSWPPKYVIFATDFSASSERAGSFARMMARSLRAELMVAHVFNLSEFAAEVEAETGPGAKSVQRKDLEGALTASMSKFGEGVERVTSTLLEGDPVEQIPALAAKHTPSVVVLGTRGRGRLGRSIVGSTADAILRTTEGPSVTVGPQVSEPAWEAAPIRRVVFATDLTPAAARGAAYAVGVAEGFGASLEALHVVPENVMNDQRQLNRVHEEFHAALEGALLKRTGNLPEPKEFVAAGSAHTRILEHVREQRADLLVLSVRRSSNLWLRERLSGAFHIVANATCPVMTITG